MPIGTPIPWGDDRAVVKFSTSVSSEVVSASFWGRNFMSTDGSKPLHRITDLQSGAGDQLRIDKFYQLGGTIVPGDSRAVGQEERVRGNGMKMWINQARKPVGTGGKMSQKRTVHDLRLQVRDKSKVFWSRWFDEELFVYATGTRGCGSKQWLHPRNTGADVASYDFGGFAGNTLNANPSTHVFWPGATGTNVTDNTIASGDVLTPRQLEYYAYEIQQMTEPLEPIIINGEEMYIFIMSPYQEYIFKAGTAPAQASSDFWQMKKYGKSEKDLPWSGVLGKWGQFLLFSHNKIIKTIPSDDNAIISHNLILGAQAVALAHGDAGEGLHFSWYEEPRDYGNEKVVVTGTMYGVQKVAFPSDPDDSSSTLRPRGVVVAKLFDGSGSGLRAQVDAGTLSI